VAGPGGRAAAVQLRPGAPVCRRPAPRRRSRRRARRARARARIRHGHVRGGRAELGQEPDDRDRRRVRGHADASRRDHRPGRSFGERRRRRRRGRELGGARVAGALRASRHSCRRPAPGLRRPALAPARSRVASTARAGPADDCLAAADPRCTAGARSAHERGPDRRTDGSRRRRGCAARDGSGAEARRRADRGLGPRCRWRSVSDSHPG
jgi:hypothetical protein